MSEKSTEIRYFLDLLLSEIDRLRDVAETLKELLVNPNNSTLKQ